MVWANQFRLYAAERVYRPRLDEPLESYSAQDLEHWVLLRRSADVGWKRKDLQLTQRHWLRQQAIGTVCIVPGGRWLLVGDAHSCSVTVYDMDAPALTGRVLIPQNDEDTQPVEHIVIEVDSEQQSSCLTFTMALSPYLYQSEASICCNGIHLIRVSLLYY
jgi:hypothetical protein